MKEEQKKDRFSQKEYEEKLNGIRDGFSALYEELHSNGWEEFEDLFTAEKEDLRRANIKLGHASAIYHHFHQSDPRGLPSYEVDGTRTRGRVNGPHNATSPVRRNTGSHDDAGALNRLYNRNQSEDKEGDFNWSRRVPQFMTSILYFAFLFVYYSDISKDGDNMSEQSHKAKQFVLLFWILPYSSFLLWLVLRSHIICSRCCTKPGSLTHHCLTALQTFTMIVLCSCCESKPSRQIEKAMIDRRIIFQILTGVISAVVIKNWEMRSSTLLNYLFMYGLLEIMVLMFEHRANVTNCIHCCRSCDVSQIVEAQRFEQRRVAATTAELEGFVQSKVSDIPKDDKNQGLLNISIGNST